LIDTTELRWPHAWEIHPTKLIDWLIDWTRDSAKQSFLPRYFNLPLHNTANTKQLESLPSPLPATIINGAGGGSVFKVLNLNDGQKWLEED